ncbi:MAG TPA: class I SAM-dependent methyltransferase [Nitrolancea sp.]|nr:class I SAM-dependent methyltransferase [Nitrolancea sp.]
MTGQEILRRSREQYAAAGNAYVLSDTHRFGKDLGRLVEVAEPNDEMRALDIATGGGHTAIALAPYVKVMTMLDLTPEMLVHARDFAHENNVELFGVIAAAAEALPFASASFDLVTCRIAPHHFADVQAFIDESARVLVPGGIFVLIDSVTPDNAEYAEFINHIERWRDPSHVLTYSLAQWTAFLAHAGLTIETSEMIEKSHEFESWTVRSRMPEGEPEALSNWILASDEATKAFFSVEEHDGRVVSFKDLKILLRARKPVA